MAWKVAYTSRKTGNVIPCAAEKFALIEFAEERQKEKASLNGNDESRSLEDFEKDPIAEVLGNEKRKSYCRTISSTSTMKQAKLTQASKAIDNFKENEDIKWKIKIENTQDRLAEEFKSMNSTMVSIQQSLLQFMNQYEGNVALRNEVAFNMERHNDSPGASLGVQSNGVIGSSTRERQSVILLSQELKEVANLGTQKTCHHREVVHGEKVVWMEKVFDLEAPIYEAPKNGNYKLFDIIDGGFVIWPEYRVRYL